MIFFKLILSYIKNSFVSLASFLVIKIIPKKNITNLLNSLENKKLLFLDQDLV